MLGICEHLLAAVKNCSEVWRRIFGDFYVIHVTHLYCVALGPTWSIHLIRSLSCFSFFFFCILLCRIWLLVLKLGRERLVTYTQVICWSPLLRWRRNGVKRSFQNLCSLSSWEVSTHVHYEHCYQFLPSICCCSLSLKSHHHDNLFRLCS